MIQIDFNEKVERLREIILASYDWQNESSFDEKLKENLDNADAEIRKFYNDNFKDI